MRFSLLILTLLSATAINTLAQSAGQWNGKRCAVVLTYDDGLNVHLDNVVPLLDSLGFKATFYVQCAAQSLRDRAADWKNAAASGHELGNHSLFHPCSGSLPGREWLSPDYDLDDYSPQKMVDEIRLANVFLHQLDGQDLRTLAYTCGDKMAGGEDFSHMIHEDFVGARGVHYGIRTIDEIDLYNIDVFAVDNNRAEELIDQVKEAERRGGLLVFLFHGVGGEHSMNVGLDEHRKLVNYLRAHGDQIWVAPMVEVAQYIKAFKP